MKHILFAILLFSGLSSLFCACIESAPKDSVEILTRTAPSTYSGQGIYVKNQGIFTCPEGKFYRLEKGFMEKLMAAENHYLADYNPTDELYNIELNGSISGDKLTIEHIDSLSIFTSRSCCLPFEFWGTGTEPFWSVCIAPSINLVYCFDMGKVTFKGAYATPQSMADGTKKYTIRNAEQKMEIIVKPDLCSDGMSDQEYNYIMEVHTNDRVLQGCAYTFQERGND